ncbi:Segmentation protein cap'n'collar-like Protein [Tribolium castaneum]|uniref:Segmentation protein cap'n'collar-like Protein n=1 Tax=Tribolium castaneum TaxID=7070 RepID=A0A139WP14_TRICA|nr:Segmentation protein cap'n'collar-like Protein [Tribolium castaneum]
MLSLKKVYRDELLQIALILSLLRGNSGPYLENDLFNNTPNYDFDNGTSWRSLTPAVLRSHFVHPKSLDSVLLNYERELFADLNLLGRYNRDSYRHPDVTAYLLNIERATAPLATQDAPSDLINSAQSQNEESASPAEAATAPIDVGLELTQEVCLLV